KTKNYVYSLSQQHRDLRDLHSFPTRRSSDLKGGVKRLDKVHQRLGRLAEKYPSAYRYYDIDIQESREDNVAVDIKWEKNPEKYRSEEHTSELQSRENLVCRLLLEKKNNRTKH